jgi:hypothetical protein
MILIWPKSKFVIHSLHFYSVAHNSRILIYHHRTYTKFCQNNETYSLNPAAISSIFEGWHTMLVFDVSGLKSGATYLGPTWFRSSVVTCDISCTSCLRRKYVRYEYTIFHNNISLYVSQNPSSVGQMLYCAFCHANINTHKHEFSHPYYLPVVIMINPFEIWQKGLCHNITNAPFTFNDLKNERTLCRFKQILVPLCFSSQLSILK